MLTANLVRKIGPDVNWDAVRKDVLEIGHPVGAI
jgi:hypothetical protein